MTAYELWDQILTAPMATLDQFEHIAGLAEQLAPADLSWEEALQLSPAIEKRRDAVRNGAWQPYAAERALAISARLTDVVNSLSSRGLRGPEKSRTAAATEAAAAIRLELAAAAGVDQPAPGAAGLGARLKRERLRCGLSPATLAESAGLTGPTVEKIEKGGGWRGETIERLAAALGVSPAMLAGWT